MTVQSFTDSRKSYETTSTNCTCPDFQYRGSKTGKPCKHMVAVKVAKAERFAALRNRYDYRLNGTLETRRCYIEMALGF